MTLFDGERIDYVNDSLSLIQKTDGLTFGTDALLLAGYVSGRHKLGIELGAGSGIMDMMGGFTVLRLTSMMGMMNISFTKEELLKFNKQLNRIKKPVKKG